MDKKELTRHRVKEVDRKQLKFKIVDLENVIPPGHRARLIWEFVGRQDLTKFYEDIKTVDGVAGREAWDPRMMITLWVYAISKGINSAREISRGCEYEPALMWITGDRVINHHSLSDFRVGHGEALRQLFIDILGAMSSQGLVKMKRVMQDGTKIEADASSNSFRREGTLLKHLEMAREAVKQMEENSDERIGKKTRKRRESSAKERLRRLEKAVLELEKMRAEKDSEKEKKETRVSLSDPESRVMREGNGGFDPCFNGQILTDAENKIIVGVSLTQEGNDIHQLENSLFEIDRNTGKKPAEMVVDSGYISGDNIIKMSGTGIDLYGPMPDNESKGKRKSEMAPEFYSEKFTYDAAANSFTCPAGKSLRYKSQYKTGQFTYYAYLARKSDCQQCPFKSQCCPKTKSTGRTVTRKQILPEVEAFNKKMSTEESKAIYKERSPVAEFPNLWIKEKLGLRRFRVRGLVKAGLELLWAALTYNLQHWIRLSGGKLSPGLS